MIPIDLCICLSGPLVDVLLPITMETLRRNDALEGVTLHFVDKDCTPAVKRYLLDSGAKVHEFTSPKRFKPTAIAQTAEQDIERDVVNGTVTTLNWMWKTCGTNEWVFIMHFDLEFKTPWLSYLRNLIAPSVGQIGDHACGLVGYNRTALQQAEVGFNCMWNFFVVRDHYGNWKLRHEKDLRCTDHSMPFHGFDTNELLELNLQHWGWQVITETDVESNKWRVHNGAGSGRCPESNQMIRERALVRLRELRIQPIT